MRGSLHVDICSQCFILPTPTKKSYFFLVKAESIYKAYALSSPKINRDEDEDEDDDDDDDDDDNYSRIKFFWLRTLVHRFCSV